ncbi:uncharacterized protein ARMOST_15686 [Armillaria ostoyae]|uniref:N-acetyltransferase domain-containing protein n=1 Tax=Armillaria ostoyae TaxID=47428 RepID=A0A284RU32_ARMOS|nr:uncharacterized protein ARMOST_15686 [Armillaria ostoyae]
MSTFTPASDLVLKPRKLTGRDNPHVDVPTYIAEWPWLEQLLYTIQKKDTGEQLGRIVCQFIDAKRVPGNMFFRQMDAVSDDLSNLASAVFTSNGRLNTEVRESGLCLWDAEDARKIYDSPIVYIQEIQVSEGWRGKGIGSWAVTQLFETAKVKGIGSSYLFTWPSILGRYDPPPRNHANPGAPPTKEDQDAWEAKRDPIIKFFRSNGFRRPAHTNFFCLAKDPKHCSRGIAADEDAEYRPRPAPENEVEMLRNILTMFN